MNVDPIKKRLAELEARVRKLQDKGQAFPLSDEELSEAKIGAEVLLKLAEEVKGQWKGKLSAVEEVRQMRASSRGS